MIIDKVDRLWMLRNMHRMVDWRDKVGMELWSWVRQVCGVGSHTAREICLEYGWDPNVLARLAKLEVDIDTVSYSEQVMMVRNFPYHVGDYDIGLADKVAGDSASWYRQGWYDAVVAVNTKLTEMQQGKNVIFVKASKSGVGKSSVVRRGCKR